MTDASHCLVMGVLFLVVLLLAATMAGGLPARGYSRYEHFESEYAPKTAPAVVVTLYHAEWCPHCLRFAPEWASFKEAIASDPGLGIETREYEAGADGARAEEKKHDVKGYPTLIVSHQGSATRYTGPRTADALLQHVKALASGTTGAPPA